MRDFDSDIQFETEHLLDYYVVKLEECQSLAEVYELNWYVKDRIQSVWRDLFESTIEISKELYESD
jgi:hypothetical protein